MGNSGSMSGLSGYEEGYHHHPGYHHHHQRYHDAMRGEPASGMSASWMDSYQRDHHRRSAGRDHEQQQQIKVLPDIPGKVAKLRSTNNGSILHAGGTISKNNQALQRSKSISSPTYQQHQQQQQQPASFSECDEDLELSSLQPPRMLMQRSRTQLNLMPPGLSSGVGGVGGNRTRNGYAYGHEDESARGGPTDRGGRQAARYGEAGNGAESLNHRKRFGSEPDLRLSLVPRNGQQPEQAAGGSRNPKMAQSKIMKGKNKKKAPVPPVMDKRDSNKDVERQRIIAYSPMRKPGSDANTSTLPSSSDGSFNVAATRKLRLFKTRAETKKTPTIAKLPEASDAKFPGKHGPSNGPAGGFLRAAVPLQPNGTAPHVVGHVHRNDGGSPDDEKLKTVLDHLSPRPNPVSFFRREKTFDAGLLGLERQRETEPRPATKPTMSPPLSRRKSIVKSYLEQDAPLKPSAPATNRTDAKARQQIGTAAESYQRKQALAEAQRKQSSAATAAITDFQKELQLATRRKTGSTDTTNNGTSPLTGQPKQQRIAVGAAGASGGGSGVATSEQTNTRFSLLPTVSGGKSKTTSNNALVINVEPPSESEQCAGTKADGKQDARDSPPPPTPPPPPPPPKTSFYFGMRDDRHPTDAPRRFSGTKRASPAFVPESRADDSEDSERECEARREQPRPQQDIDGQSVEEIGHTQMELIDQFAASLLNSSRFRSSDSVASSEADVRTGAASTWDDADGPGQQEIALKLRPTLPRKQFDIPRFSPAAAWRLLTTEDEFCRDAPADGHGGTAGGEKKSFLRGLDQELDVPEDRIQRVYREPVPGLQDNKSGDSGISGDAGILADIGQDALLASSGKEERAGDTSPESGTQLHKVHGTGAGAGTVMNGGWSSSALLLMPWTPQQDLDDDEDEDEDEEDEQEVEEEDVAMSGGVESARRHQIEDGVARVNGDARPDFSTKGHLFSLSLPRENHLSIYNVESADEKVEKHVFNSLQKFRKSVSGAFKHDDNGSGQLDSNDSNWFLGRLDTKLTGGGTGPGSGPEKRSKLLLPDGRERDSADTACGATASIGTIAQNKHSSIGYLVSGKHMMYLPKEPTKLHAHTADKSSKQDENNNRKSYHNQNGTERRPDKPVPPAAGSAAPAQRTANGKENLQDPVPVAASSAPAPNGELESFPVKLSNRRNHRFTFQSTIRQIEKRRVAEKLSREAEIKEAMRLSELEAMRRVEEEFQKKRAREKASIRHQLRLFSMENHPDQHHPANDGDGEQDSTGETKRSDPDGDSLPHQSAIGRGGLYRKKEYTARGSMERQYKRSGAVTSNTNPHAGGDELDMEHEMELAKVATVGRRRYGDDDDDDDEDDDGEGSSLGYVDTRTPYISRIIQAKSSKSYAMKK